MAESTKLRRGRGKSADDLKSNGRAEESDSGESQVELPASASDAGDKAQEQGGTPKLTAELRDTIREAAIEVLRPVARKATTSAAKYAVTKGPDLVKDRVGPKIVEAGGAGALAKGVASKGGGLADSVTSAAGGITEKLGGIGKGKGKGKSKSPTGTGRGRRLPVQVYVDVAADLETTYDQFTQFEDWPNFMHRVEKIEQRDDSTLMWHENIWGVRRSWEAEITEQTPCERIVWRSSGGPQTVGVATFHRMSDNLTRVYVNLDFQPQGLFEKAASGMRLSRRALTSDLMRFKAFVEMRDEATGAWRGQIEDGEVVDEGDEGEGEGDEATGREDEEPQASEEEDFEDEAEEDSDEEEPKARRRRRRSRSRDEEDEEEASEEPEDVSDEEPADEDEAEEPEEEPEPPRKKPARRRSRSTTSAAGGRR